MKAKMKLLTVGVFLSIYSLNTAIAQWRTNGNGPGALTLPANSVLGTNAGSTQPLRIITNGVNRINILPTGEIGVGNLGSAAFKLDVTGNGRFTQPLTIGGYTLPNTAGSIGQVLKSTGGTGVAWQNEAWVTSGSDIYNGNTGLVGIGGAPFSGDFGGKVVIQNFTEQNAVSIYSDSPGGFGSIVTGTLSQTTNQGEGSAYGFLNQVLNAGVDGTTVIGVSNQIGNATINIGVDNLVSSTLNGASIFGTREQITSFGTNASSIGVVASAHSEGTDAFNYGISSSATSIGANTTNYGIIATSSATGANTVNYAAYFDGDVTVTGIFSNPSDIKLKENIKSMPSILSLINKLQPKNYNYKSNEVTTRLSLPRGKQYGLVAQELEEVFPELVTKNIAPPKYDKNHKKIVEAEEFKGINYIGLIPILIQGMKEQQEMIEKLQFRLAALESFKSNSSGIGSNNTLERNTSLAQNMPNPFDRYTTISYELKESGNIELTVYSLTGNEIKKLASGNKSAGTYDITWDASEVPSGTYLYVLKVNGQEIVKKAICKK